MNEWIENRKAEIKGKAYWVLGYRLYDTDYYGEYGEYEHRSKLPLDEWMLKVFSYDNGYAGTTASKKKMEIRFKERDEANKYWKFLKDKEPDWNVLESIGFEYFN